MERTVVAKNWREDQDQPEEERNQMKTKTKMRNENEKWKILIEACQLDAVK